MTAQPDGPLELRMTRVLRAAPDEVFDAYTDADQQKVWFTILDERPGVVEITTDLRVGGRQVAVWGPDENTLFRETQTFLEIDRPRRLVTESTGSSPDGTTMTTLVTVTFDPHEDGTLMTVVQSGFPVPEVRDFFVDEVWNGAFARMDAFLRRPAGSRAVDAYIAAFPPEVVERLSRVRAILLDRLTGGTETVRYDMPAVMLGSRYGLHFAGWKKHVALYPVPVLDGEAEERLAPYRTGKDSVRFLHARDLPYDLVGAICDHLVAQRGPAAAQDI